MLEQARPSLLRVPQREIAALVGAAAAVVAGAAIGVAADIAIVGAAAASTILILVEIPEFFLALHVHSGVWNTAPAFASIGQEAPTAALVAVSLIPLVARLATHRIVLDRHQRRVIGLTLAFLGFVGLRLALAPSPDAFASAGRLLLFGGWAIVLAVMLGSSRRSVAIALSAVAASAALIALYALSQHDVLATWDLAAFDENRIVFGRSVGAGAVIAAGLLGSGAFRRTVRLMLAGLLALLLTITLLSASRGALISALLAIGLSWILSSRRASASGRLLTALCAAMAGLVLVLVFLDAPAVSRLVSLVNFESDATAAYRLQSMADGLRRFAESPLIGAGFGAMPTDVVFDGAGQTVVYPHNVMVELLAATGVVGLILALAPILVSLRLVVSRCRSVNASPWTLVVLGCLLFFLISAQFSGDLEVNRHIWTFALLGGAPAVVGSLS